MKTARHEHLHAIAAGIMCCHLGVDPALYRTLRAAICGVKGSGSFNLGDCPDLPLHLREAILSGAAVGPLAADDDAPRALAAPNADIRTIGAARLSDDDLAFADHIEPHLAAAIVRATQIVLEAIPLSGQTKIAKALQDLARCDPDDMLRLDTLIPQKTAAKALRAARDELVAS